tara:strand:+ start:2034 stop:2825 length:792 start_codon:yes stop_codon:yes gene_type:complete
MKKFIKRLNIKPPSKKFWAREILIIIILSVISTSAYFINENRNSNIRSNIKKTEAELKIIQNKIDGFGSYFFKHWILLKDYGAFEGDYESFKKEYGDYSKSGILSSLTYNNGIKIKEFKRKMYTKDYHLDRLYDNYRRSYTARSRNWRWFDSFSKTQKSFLTFKDMLFSNENFLKANYQLYILENKYDWSIEKFKKLISTDTHIVDSDKYFSLLPTLESKKSELNKLEDSWFKIEEYIFIFILIVYGLRVFVSIVRWSIKQLS